MVHQPTGKLGEEWRNASCRGESEVYLVATTCYLILTIFNMVGIITVPCEESMT